MRLPRDKAARVIQDDAFDLPLKGGKVDVGPVFYDHWPISGVDIEGHWDFIYVSDSNTASLYHMVGSTSV